LGDGEKRRLGDEDDWAKERRGDKETGRRSDWKKTLRLCAFASEINVEIEDK
jgi:hypothetical protein